MWGNVLVILGVVLSLFQGSKCHVTLTFPPARYPPLDFLDTVRTGDNCGVPKLKNPHYTTLIADRTYKITWSMAYAHQGGYRISLLDEAYTEIIQLVPSIQDPQIQESYTQPAESQFNESIVVTLPANVTCEPCILKIERQALEWGDGYRFHSCADVNIVPENKAGFAVDRTCMNHGQVFNGSCDCDYLYRGRLCQYHDECEEHEHCGGEGKGWCAHTSGHSDPRKNLTNNPYSEFIKKCYCKPPFFGRNCENEFVPSQIDMSEGCFNFSFPSFYHTVPGLGRQIVNSSPLKYGLYNPACYNFEQLGDQGGSIHWRTVADEMEIILELPTTSWVALGWRPVGVSKGCRKLPGMDSGDYEPEPEPEAEHSYGEPIGTAEEPHPEGEGPYSADQGPEPIMKSDLWGWDNRQKRSVLDALEHPMDCTDIVMASVHVVETFDHVSYVRVGDFYTRDRSTPLPDEIYKGRDHITAAYGFQKDGKTVVMFRKPITASDTADHSFAPGKMQVIWAMGQGASSAYGHEFYKQDELKYHGGNRGLLRMEFVSRDAQKASGVAGNFVLDWGLIFVCFWAVVSVVFNCLM